MIYRLALSGLINSGKDYVAQQCGYTTMSFARALYVIAKVSFGDDDYKNKPDIRRFLQKVGQWGWGYWHPAECPYDTERATFCHLMRTQGLQLTGMSEYMWGTFGLVKTFWVDGLLRYVAMKFDSRKLIAVTNVRYEHELAPINKYGYEHFLVKCSEKTRMERCGGSISDSINYNISEMFARELENTVRDDCTIWNDTEPMPTGKKYLTVAEFQKVALAT